MEEHHSIAIGDFTGKRDDLCRIRLRRRNLGQSVFCRPPAAGRMTEERLGVVILGNFDVVKM